MAIAAPVDAADMLERLLQLSDQLEEALAAYGDNPPEALLRVRKEMADWECQLQDVLDAQEAADARADARGHGTIPWSELKSRLHR